MTQEGKPLPSGRRVLGTQPPPVPNPTSHSRRPRVHHLAQEWRSAVPLANCLKKEDQDARMKE